MNIDSMTINNKKLDRRVKLTDTDKESIVREYKSGEISINGLSRKYNVSKRLIQFTLFPERKEKAKELYKQRSKDGRYYDKEKHKEYVKKHRYYKKELFEKGLLE